MNEFKTGFENMENVRIPESQNNKKRARRDSNPRPRD